MHMPAELQPADVLAALGNPARLRIVGILRSGEKCVCQIAPLFTLDRTTINRCLTQLEQAGIVVSRRQSRWTHYRIRDRRVLKVIDTVFAMLGQEDAEPTEAKTGRRCCRTGERKS
jgi:DNA-binding transcriptional ArsR family regulator